MINLSRNFSYIDGTAAKKLEYDVYEENKVLKAKKTYKTNKKHKIRFVLTLICVFVVGLSVMARYAMITQIGYEISRSRDELKEIRNQNNYLSLQIEKETDLEKIKLAAEQRLGMQTPEKSQIVYVNVPRNDFTIVMNDNSKAVDSRTGQIKSFLQEKIPSIASIIK